MSDKIEWMNQHFLLLKYNRMEDLIAEGGYELPLKYTKMLRPGMGTQEFIMALAEAGKTEEAIRVLAYAIHHRAGVWWGVCCIRDLYADLAEGERQAKLKAEKEAEEKKKREEAMAAESQKKREEEAKQEEEDRKSDEEVLKKLEEAQAKFDKIKSEFTPEEKEIYDLIMKKANEIALEREGMTWDALFAIAKGEVPMPEEAEEPEAPEPPEKPEVKIPEEEDEDEPDIPPEMLAELKSSTLQSVIDWVQAPTKEITQILYNKSQQIPDEPEGMLASTAFWSYGDLAVTDDNGQIVPVPPGLAGNGLSISMLIMSLADGGLYTQKQRMGRYLKLGYEVAIGRSNWTVGQDPSSA